MERKFNYQIGDYVQVPTSQTGSNKIYNIGRIVDINTERNCFKICLPQVDKILECETDVKLLLTDEHILIKLGFTKLQIGNSSIMELRQFKIAQILLVLRQNRHAILYFTDISKGNPNINDYVSSNEDGGIDYEKLNNEYPYLGNVNTLLKYLNDKGEHIDIEKFILEYYKPE